MTAAPCAPCESRLALALARRSLVLSLALGSAVPSLLFAQSVRAVAAGRVLLARGGDSLPVAGTRVVLHEVARAVQGPIDSVTTDAAGRFRFRFAADTGAVYLISARYAAIEYFSPPVHVNAARPDTALTIVVFDTSSTAPVALAARHLVVAAPADDGTRGVLDLIVLRNAGAQARVAPDTVTPTWTGPLPEGSFGLDPGDGDYSPDAVQRRDDRLLFLAPIPPGEKQLLVEYALFAGGRSVELPMEHPAELVNVLVAEPEARVTTPGLAPQGTEVIEGRTYRRWAGGLPAGAVIRIDLPAAGRVPGWILPTLVGIVALVLALGAWRLVIRRSHGAAGTAGTPGAAGVAASSGPPKPVAGTVDAMLDALAELDARYRDRESDLTAEERERYRAERARLKAELVRVLGTAPPAP